MAGWKDYINAYTIAGAGAGMYAGHAKYGKKHGYKAIAGGAVAGLIAGVLVEKLVGPKQPTPAQIAAAAAAVQQQQVTAAQQQQAGQGEYVDLDGNFGEFVAPPPSTANPMQRAEYEAQRAAFENLGSLSGTDGLGSLSGAPGFDSDTLDYDEILGEGGGSDFN